MREPKTSDILLLILLGAVWGSAFFNIKIATYTYDTITLVFVRVFFAFVALGLYCFYKKVKILAFSKHWKMYALVGLTNITIPFLLIAYGTNVVDSYLSAILMSTTPLSGTLLAHFFTSNEKLNIFKSLGVTIGFFGVLFLFFDKLVISESNIFYAIVILCGSTFYVIGGILTLKFLKNEGNENVSTSTILWSLIFLLPFCLYQQPWLNLNPSMESTIALIYLGIFPTGVAWMLRFHILTKVGMVFQTQVAYLIPIFGVIFGYLLMDEQITWKVLASLIIIITGIYIVKKGNKNIKNL
ncbi:MAG: EamA family transporter [Candidatus Marinimicrobia bacterium]|nr:EamA family transporter [Candidatus Neomarinimicrobiota bacterium]|tara:strand:+ start:1862 stop:2755 length:894 start_codon:yes stop_codon:yes gene_type:complete